MTRREDDKRGGQDSTNTHNAKVERRFTKEAKAKTNQDGTIDGRKMGRDFADNKGGKGHPDKGPA